jgi:hypothetical protein
MKGIANKIEICFWNFTIPLLSESQFIRSTFREVHTLYNNRNNILVILLFTSAGLALVAGFVLGRSQFLF